METRFHAVGRGESEVGLGKEGLVRNSEKKKRKVEKKIVNRAKRRRTQAFS